MERLAASDQKHGRGTEGMKAELKHHNDIDRSLWIDFLGSSAQGALYAHPDYLDVVAPEWQGIEVWVDRSLVAIMPLLIKVKAGYEYALQPSFCQYWGIFFGKETKSTPYKQFSNRRKIVKTVVEAIPSNIKWFLSGFAPEFDYPHPFHWGGYRLNVRYTYRLELAEGYAALEKGFGSDTRSDMRKAIAKGIQIEAAKHGEGLMKLIQENHAGGKHLLELAELGTLEKLVPMMLEKGLGTLLEARDSEGQLIGAALFGGFAGKTAYLMSAQSQAAKSNGAMTYLLGTAIEMACQKDRIFDFEGSMIEPIEGFFRGFGGTPVPYLMIEKNQLPLLVRWIRKLR